MKLGFCCPPERLYILERCGIDNIELSVAQLENLTDTEREDFRKRLAGSSVAFESVNCLIGGFSLYEDANFVKTRAHLERVLPELASFGVNKVVFGSGGYRKVPEGMEREEAKARIYAFLRLLSEMTMPYGIVTVLEHLPVRSCNILTSSAEAAAYVRDLKLPNLKLLIDFWHLLYEGERLDVLPGYGDILAHTHIANPIHGHTPAPGDAFDVTACVRALRLGGYDGAIVAEVVVKGDLEESVRGFKTVMDAAIKEAFSK
ncbi:MAG: sugar phosphate isomerase/epimerase family protein [Clostridiaceae bacterium]|nr:sugar phosphate isomerase/epimerase family protein [Clostridiaceae bacterium]